MNSIISAMRTAAFALACACAYGALFLGGVLLNGAILTVLVPVLFERPALLPIVQFPFGTLVASAIVFALGMFIGRTFLGLQKQIIVAVSLLPSLIFLVQNLLNQDQKSQGLHWFLAGLTMYVVSYLLGCKKGNSRSPRSPRRSER